MPHIKAIVHEKAICQECGRYLLRHAIMDDGSILGMDCAAYRVLGDMKTNLRPIEKMIAYIQRSTGTPKHIATQAQKINVHIPVFYGKNFVSVHKDNGPGQPTTLIARINL